MSCGMSRQAEQDLPSNTWLGAWLATIAALVAGMILVGGATRLTDSGLSITEWDFARHFVPPLTDAGWDRAFDLYRQTTEYQLQNRGMSLGEFKHIYFWEWGHRFLGQVIGLAFAGPFAYFWLTGRLKGRFWPILGLGALGGLQGAVGWWMVVSGLQGRLDVSPIRLAIHLGIAFAIVALAVRLSLDAFGLPRGKSVGPKRIWVVALWGALFVQIILGALVAGNDAGRSFSDWPTIGGRWLPEYEGAVSDVTSGLATVQFHHRTFGYLVAAATLALAAAWWKGTGPARTAATAAAALVLAQTGLGIGAVMLGAPLWISLIHQGVALLLWLVIAFWHKAAR
jgi:heme a synthase